MKWTHDQLMLWLDAEVPKLAPQLVKNFRKVLQKVWELPVKDGPRIHGFIDLAVIVQYQDERNEIAPASLLFEVKPEIESLGAVIRQIRGYDAFVSSYVAPFPRKWFVVSPNVAFRAILEDQRIGLITPGFDQGALL